MSIMEALDGNADDSIYFSIPSHFNRVDLTEPPEARIRRTYEDVQAVLGNPDSDQCSHIATLLEMMISRLVDYGAVYVAQGFAQSEANPGTLCTAQFTIFVKEAELETDQPLSLLASGLRDPGSPRQAAVVEYPAGAAVVVGEELEVSPSVTAAGRPTMERYRMRQAQVLLPFPNRRRVAVLSLTSTHLDDWHHFVRILNDIACSFSFTPRNDNSVVGRLEV